MVHGHESRPNAGQSSILSIVLLSRKILNKVEVSHVETTDILS